MNVSSFIIESVKPYKYYLYFVAFLIILSGLEYPLKSYILKLIIDDVSVMQFHRIWMLVVWYCIAQALTFLLWYFFDWCELKYMPQIKRDIAIKFIKKIGLYDHHFFQEHPSSTISSRIKDAAKIIPRIMELSLIQPLHLLVTIIISVALLFKVHPIFGLTMLIWVSAFVVMCYIKIKKIGLLAKKEAEYEINTYGEVNDYVSNMMFIKIFSSLLYEKSRLKIQLEKLMTKSITTTSALISYFRIQHFIFSSYIGLCLISMVYCSSKGIITPGDFALVFMTNLEIITRLFHITFVVREIIIDYGTLKQALSILEYDTGVKDKPNASTLVVKEGMIQFHNVKFHHKNSTTLFLNKSITIPPKQKIGLVGYSGSGKSTFINLILRLYDIVDGSIYIDKQDICQVRQDSLRNAISVIPQDVSLFSRSIMENIRYGKISATDQEVIEAAKKAHIHDFITKLPKGYDSLVGERGSILSGGQKQRIAIARAILKNAPILILDEATSHLDSVIESAIQKSIAELMKNKTSIIIAHRLSTLLTVDRIVVFENGNIIEDDTHANLLKKGGTYKKLWDAQVGGFLPNGEI
ncbi:ABC transporter ATP-binding protein [Candidatus Fokinia crypta]|uniref:ABC-transporter permease/ATP-binding protein n=1 Tax=Candidatus Fokinia crypta TaxID=1920990 RepID=A0ABZ0UR69_9RICK|nr:ABC transporter ATP-binding protein [Candidatus Fokinia cryptica]WPX97638.1 ABC-transporter permease/ATP-binding protein [Candidatus Fokinia cryptica]